MIGQATGVAFLPSADLERSRRFFADTLGLPVESLTPAACVLRAGSTTLRVTRVPEFTPQPFTVFGWTVPDLPVAVSALVEAGITPLRFAGLDQDEAGVWVSPGGDRVVWFHDPDGNVLSLHQLGGFVGAAWS